MRKWHWLALGAAAVGVVVVRRRSAVASTARDVEETSQERDARIGVDRLIGAALDQATALRSGLKDNPLAASLLGIDPSLIAAGSPAQVADTAAEAATRDAEAERLRTEIANRYDDIRKETAQYAVNHNGGQSPDEFRARIGSLQAAADALAAQLAAL